MLKDKINFTSIISVFLFSLSVVSLFAAGVEVYLLGFRNGEYSSQIQYQILLDQLSKDKVSSYVARSVDQTPDPKAIFTPKPQASKPTWGGPELWEEVNKSRIAHGVGALKQRDELCTIAAIRLNELLLLGQLDGHEGFAKLEDREDLKWIFEKYVVAEFLVQGAPTASEAVELWLNTLGHKKLITGGEYAYGCTYAQEGFGVAISAYE